MMRSLMPRHGWSPQRLFAMLKDCQARERESWRSTLLSNSVNQQVEIGPADRDYAVTWMSHLNSRFNFYPETFFLAVHNLDRFLTAVKSRPKYLKCIAATCLYVASKLVEEEEHIPGTGELAEVSRSGCHPRDILRMERIVLTKLNWDFHTPTALTYMEIFYALIFSSTLKKSLTKESDSDAETFQFLIRHLNQLTAELQHVICNYSLTPFPSAALALALLSLRIENLSSEPQCWATVTSQMQALAKIKTSDLMRCRDILRTILPHKQHYTNRNNSVYLVSASELVADVPPKMQKSEFHSTLHQGGPTKRKAQDLNATSPDIENIKKFHATDNDMVHDSGRTSPGTESKSQENLACLELANYSTVKMNVFDSVSQEMSVEEDIDCPPLTKPSDPYVGDILVESGMFETSDLETSVISCDKNETSGYDSDKTLTASEGEEDDYIEKKKHDATRMRPLTYAEIVKFGLIENCSNCCFNELLTSNTTGPSQT